MSCRRREPLIPAQPPAAGDLRRRGAAGGGRCLRSEGCAASYVVRALRRSPTFLIGAGILLFWVVMALFSVHITKCAPVQPSNPLHHARPAERRRTGSAPTSSAATCCRARWPGSRSVLIIAPLATLLCPAARRHASAWSSGYFGGYADEVIMRFVDVLLCAAGDRRGDRRGVRARCTPMPAIIRRLDRHPLHAARGAHDPRRGRDRAREGVRAGGPAARRATPLHHGRRDPAQHPLAASSSRARSGSATRSSPPPRCRSWASACSRRRPTGA